MCFRWSWDTSIVNMNADEGNVFAVNQTESVELGGADGLSGPKFLRRPGIEAAGNRLLAAAAFRRDVQADGAGVGEQLGKIRRLEKAARFGMNRIEGLFRQRVLQFTGAAGQRTDRGRTKDRDPDGGEAGRSPAPAPPRAGGTAAQRPPHRAQSVRGP